MIISNSKGYNVYWRCNLLLYPKVDNKKFESPYLEWHLNEILAPIILNDSRIQKLLKRKADFYTEHQRIKIGNKIAPKYFNDLYNYA